MIQEGAIESPIAHSTVLGNHTLSFHHLVLWFLPIIPHLETKNFQVKQINAEWNYFIPNPLVFHNIFNEYSLINSIDFISSSSHIVYNPHHQTQNICPLVYYLISSQYHINYIFALIHEVIQSISYQLEKYFECIKLCLQ